ncbi:MAG: hypothetical protein R2812_07850 [Gelidibacter sp.]
MNKVLLISILLLLIPQEKNEIDFLNYHQKFIEIEDLITNENFKDAETKLEALVVTYQPSFTKDYIILAQLCLINNNKPKSIIWLKKSMQYGAKLDCLKEIELLNKKITVNDWKKIETQNCIKTVTKPKQTYPTIILTFPLKNEKTT